MPARQNHGRRAILPSSALETAEPTNLFLKGNERGWSRRLLGQDVVFNPLIGGQPLFRHQSQLTADRVSLCSSPGLDDSGRVQKFSLKSYSPPNVL